MTNPEQEKLTELERLALEQKELEARLSDIQVQRRGIKEKKLEAEREVERLRKEEEAKQPFTVKVSSIAINRDNLPASKATLENFPAKYHEGYVNFISNVDGRIYIRTDIGNRNDIPVSQLEYVVEKLKNIEGITLDWDFQAYQQLSTYKQLVIEEKNRPDYEIDFKDQMFHIKKQKGSIWTIDYIYGTRKHVTKKEITWTLALTEGYRLTDALKNSNVKWTDAATKALEEEQAKKDRQLDIAQKTDSDVNVKFLNGHELRPFQKVGVEFIINANGNAILADVTGLGKTWQAIGMVEALNRPSIVVCPAPLKENWKREIEKLTGHHAYVCSGGIPNEWDVEALHKGEHKYIIMNYDILGKGLDIGVGKEKVTRYLWADMIRETGKYKQMIFDEAHRIKNTSANRTKATLHLGDDMNYLFLTATPILNRPLELYSPLRLIRPGQYLSERHFMENYAFSDGRVRNVEHLRDTLSTILIRRKRQDVQKDLPPIERIYDWHELSEEARARYELALEGVYKAIAEYDPDKKDHEMAIMGILAQITRCKQIVAQDKVERVADLATELVDSEKGEGEGKVVIFSGFKAVARGIARRLGQEAVCFDGDDKLEARQKMVDDFQNDPKVKFLVATGQTAGEGLTMTAAGYVIFSDFGWTPAYHMQCEGRVYGRLNEAHGAVSYYIVGAGTIEEWIQELLAKKLKIIEQVIEGNDSEDAGKRMGYELIKRMKAERRKNRG
jgi:SWI/SNF-related matrix-associated actin-dependent regulator 1 of chromatin subfamily A